MRRNRHSYIYRLDMNKEWRNAAYDENGETVICDICGSDLKWNRHSHEWCCHDCGQRFIRPLYFDYIGAQPPGVDCLTKCRENYPFCKKTCEKYLIDPSDPMLT